METKIPKTMKTAEDTAVKKTTKQDLFEELKTKEKQLAEHKVRLEGGISPGMEREVMSIDKELVRLAKIKRMRELEVQMDAPLRPKFQFENSEEYRELKRGFMKEEIENLDKAAVLVKKQKETIEKEIPELEARIEVLKKEISEAKDEEPEEVKEKEEQDA